MSPTDGPGGPFQMIGNRSGPGESPSENIVDDGGGSDSDSQEELSYNSQGKPTNRSVKALGDKK